MNARTIITDADKLDHAMRVIAELQRRVEALESVERAKYGSMTVESLIKITAMKYGISALELRDMTVRDAQRVRARRDVWVILSEFKQWSDCEIARYFNCDHTTVRFGVRKHQGAAI